MKVKTQHILAEEEHEFTTEVVFQAGASFYYERRNGGQRGAYQAGSGPNDGPEEITKSKALAICASWGHDEVEIEEP